MATIVAETFSDFVAALFNPKQYESMDAIMSCSKRFKTEEEHGDEHGPRTYSVVPVSARSSSIREQPFQDGMCFDTPIGDIGLLPTYTDDSNESRKNKREEPPKLSEPQLVEQLRKWKRIANKTAHPINEADVYKTHPGVLIQGSSSGYFISKTSYTKSRQPRRVRKTENGCRWRQQGKCYAINEKGNTVAYKTYLSYVPLKDTLNRQGDNVNLQEFETPDINFYLKKEESTDDSLAPAKKKKGVRKRAIWTMEEIVLAEDIDEENGLLSHQLKPISMICRILCNSRGTLTAQPNHHRSKALA